MSVGWSQRATPATPTLAGEPVPYWPDWSFCDSFSNSEPGGVDERVVAELERRVVRVVQVEVRRHAGRVRAAKVRRPFVARAGLAGAQARHVAERGIEDVDPTATARGDLDRVAVAGGVVVGVRGVRAAVADLGGHVGVAVAGVTALGEHRAPEALAAELVLGAAAGGAVVRGRRRDARRAVRVAAARARRSRAAVDLIRIQAADAVVVERAAHGHREDVVGLRRAAGGEAVDAQDTREERAHRGVDGDDQPPRVVGILARRDVRIGGRHEAVPPRLGERGRVGVAGIAGQVHDARERCGIGRALEPQGAAPVPRDVDDDREHREQGDDRAGEQDEDLARLPPAGLRREGRPHRARAHGLSAMIVASLIARPCEPAAAPSADNGVSSW